MAVEHMTLAEAVRKIITRPRSLRYEPLCVSIEDWIWLRDDLGQMLTSAERELLVDETHHPNFLLCGVPVIISDG